MLIQADARAIPLVDGCVQCVVTSPPYFGLRDYGTGTWIGGDPSCSHAEQRGGRNPATSSKQLTNAGTCLTQFRAVCAVCAAERVDRQIGLEGTPDAYVQTLVQVFRDVRRVLADDGVCWLNLGDSYANDTKWGGQTSGKHALALHGKTPLIRAQKSTGLKSKDLLGIPWRVAFALQADGWYLRSDVIWHKPNPMPESVTDRPTKAHEYLFLLTKSERYYYDQAAIYEPYAASTLREADEGYDGLGLKDYAAAGVQNPSDTKRSIIESIRRKQPTRGEGYGAARGNTALGNTGDRDGGFGQPMAGRNKRSVWTIPTMPYSGAHFATMPEALVEPCILAGSKFGDLTLDPFSGSGTVLAVAERLGRRGVGTDLNPAYHALAKERTAQRGLRFSQVGA